jgi:hypothetical protein
MAFSGGTSQTNTRPRWALGLCDRCGFSYLLNQLQEEFYDERPDGLLCCPTCLDRDQPQLRLGRFPVDDPQSLLDPRPDVGVPGSTSYFGWLPVGNSFTLYIQCQVGNVTVRIG